jgi:NAD(P)-dependent dehydrogenase (short-subunit alcohol dehydrogenase family)
VNIRDFSLDGCVAIVTGSRRGIGKGIALAFAEAGADVAICDLVVQDGGLDSVAEEVQRLGKRSIAVKTDTSRKSDVDNLIQKVMDEFGQIDVLVNNAGVITRSTLLDLSEDDWDKTMHVNLKGYYLCAQAVSKRMLQRKKGCIVNIASVMGIKAGTNRGAYCISKAGVIMLTKVLALELATHNIRVNAIAPGIVKTEFSEAVWGNRKLLEKWETDIPLGYVSEPEDIAKAALFLASSASKYATGHTLVVDGGWLA